MTPDAAGHGATRTRPTTKDRLRHAAGLVAVGALVALAAVVLLSAALSPDSNGTVRVALAGFCLLAVVRPAAALLVTMALVGFGYILAHLAGAPSLRVTEVLVVASLAGCGVHALLPGTAFRRALAGGISVPVVLFAMTAVASTLVWLRVDQVGAAYPADYALALWRVLSRDYFTHTGAFGGLVSPAVLLEGLALYAAVAALSRVDETFFGRALRMLAIGGAGLGALSAVRLAEIVLRNPQVIETLQATSHGLRISPQIPDYIAAGSYFTLCWLVTLGLAVAAPRRWPLWLAAGVPLMGAIYLTGSRSVIAAALAGLAVLLVVVFRRGAVAGRAVLAFGGVAVLAMLISYPWLTGRDVAGPLAQQSLAVRADLLRTGARVIAERPVFGVGLDRFFLVAGPLAPPRLNELFPGRKNPHNDFLRFGAELGLVGLGLFVWILAASGRRIWGALMASADPRLAGLAGGLVAFLTTSMVSNPLMVREVSYVFWIALGLAVSQSAALRPAGAPARAPRWRTWIAVLLGVVLVGSIPFRAKQEVAAVIDLRHVRYGLFDWDADDEGVPFRWTGRRATFFVDGDASVVEIPLRGALLPTGEPQEVEVRIDGRLADRVTVGLDWQRVRTVLPSTPSPEPRRIDLQVFPPWVPAQIVPDNEDHRELGVRLGRIEDVRRSGDGR